MGASQATGLSSPTEPCGLGPSGFDPSRKLRVRTLGARSIANHIEHHQGDQHLAFIIRWLCDLADEGEAYREALEPFKIAADLADERIAERYPFGGPPFPDDTTVAFALNLTLGHLRAAREAIATETRRAETSSGSVEDEGAAPSGDRPHEGGEQ